MNIATIIFLNAMAAWQISRIAMADLIDDGNINPRNDMGAETGDFIALTFPEVFTWAIIAVIIITAFLIIAALCSSTCLPLILYYNYRNKSRIISIETKTAVNKDGIPKKNDHILEPETADCDIFCQ